MTGVLDHPSDTGDLLPESPTEPTPEPAVADSDSDYPLTVQEAIAAVTASISAVPKGRQAAASVGGYSFRGIDDVMIALHPLLGEHGLVVLPHRVVERVTERRETSSGGTLHVTALLVEYLLVGPDGSMLTAQAWGEAADSGDKSAQKAHSQSYKTLVLQTFSIPTEDSARNDPDASDGQQRIEPPRAWSAEEQDRATAAADALSAAPDLPHLAGLRRRAEHLLTVPVRMTDGSLVPLGLLFETRLGDLTRAAS